MYTKEKLQKYDYFNNFNEVYGLDSLTGVLSRANVLGFARHLVDNNVPFMMAILDIDNFKAVNDNYGHAIGDETLKFVAKGMEEYVADDGVVGRFGGDEFIIIYFKDTSYNGVHDYIEGMLNDGGFVRKKVKISDNIKLYITATVGCASFPNDAKNYDDLFRIADKALYRGKTKGRNCFIVYVESKHKNIEVRRQDHASLPNVFSRISEISENKKMTFEDKMKHILNYITDTLQISESVFLSTDKTSIVGRDGFNCTIDDECLEVFDGLTKNDIIFTPNGLDLSGVLDNKKISNFVFDKKIITFLTCRVKKDDKTIGYLILFEGKITRIWQEFDISLLLYLSKIIEIMYLKK